MERLFQVDRDAQPIIGVGRATYLASSFVAHVVAVRMVIALLSKRDRLRVAASERGRLHKQ